MNIIKWGIVKNDGISTKIQGVGELFNYRIVKDNETKEYKVGIYLKGSTKIFRVSPIVKNKSLAEIKKLVVNEELSSIQKKYGTIALTYERMRDLGYY